jgi:hypothetical protein
MRLRLVLIGLALALPGCGDHTSAPRLEFGFNDNAVLHGLVTPARDAALTAAAGATISRVGVDWRVVQPRPGGYDWRPFDALSAALRARGIRPLWVPLAAPDWARDPSATCPAAPANCIYPPDRAHMRDWLAFVRALARRYPHAAGIEVWNEENTAGFWRPHPDPAAYGRLLRATAAELKRAAPGLRVLAGGVTGTQYTTADDIALPDFLEGALGGGTARLVDGVAFHLYATGVGRLPGLGSLSDVVRAYLNTVRRVLRRVGATGRPIWLTETGMNLLRVTPAVQAEGLTTIYRLLDAQKDVAGMLVHTLVPPGAPGEDGFALLDASLKPRPAYCQLARLRRKSC